MARPLRVEFEGAVYHVMARGNERRKVFRDDKDRQQFLDTLEEAVDRFGLRLHAFCLMPNHYHLVVGTPQGNLSRAMAWLQTTYTIRFNVRHRRSGHLFQGRYKAQLVEADEYARWLVEYIHLNPVRPRRKDEIIAADRQPELDAFPWSSHCDYAGLRAKPLPWLCLDWLAYWGNDTQQARATYQQSLSLAFGKPPNSPWQQLRHGLVLGADQLERRVRDHLKRKRGLEEARWTETAATATLRATVGKLIANEEDDRVRIWARVRLGGERPADIARQYGYSHSSSVAMLIKRLEREATRNEPLRLTLQTIQSGVKSEM